MITIQKVREADCDRATDDNGNFTDSGWLYLVCHDNDVSRDIAWCETEEEADAIAEEMAFDEMGEQE